MDPFNDSPYLIELVQMYVGDVKVKMDRADPKGRKWMKYEDGDIRADSNSDDSTRQARLGRAQDPAGETRSVSDYEVCWVQRHIHRWDGNDWHFWTLNNGKLLTEPELLLRALADAFDEPFADSSALPTYLVSQLAAEHVKVALSGEGGDELFGGYYTYAADLWADRLAPLARAARPLVEALPASTRKASLDYKAKRFVRAAHLPPLERHHGWKEIFSAEARTQLTGRQAAFDPVDVYRARYAETAAAPQLARLQDVDFGIYLVDDLLVKTDRASMAHSLEVRVPFLDPLVTNLAFALPTRLKVRGLAKKVLLRKAVEPLVPAEVVHGRKRGFSIPAAAWLRGELEPFARETLSPENLQRQGFFQPQPVARLIDEHVAGREDWSRQLWGLLAFTLWYERHVEQEPPRLESARMEALAA